MDYRTVFSGVYKQLQARSNLTIRHLDSANHLGSCLWVPKLGSSEKDERLTLPYLTAPGSYDLAKAHKPYTQQDLDGAWSGSINSLKEKTDLLTLLSNLVIALARPYPYNKYIESIPSSSGATKFETPAAVAERLTNLEGALALFYKNAGVHVEKLLENLTAILSELPLLKD